MPSVSKVSSSFRINTLHYVLRCLRLEAASSGFETLSFVCIFANVVFIARKRSLGNVFTPVCLSVILLTSVRGSLYDVTSCLATWSPGEILHHPGKGLHPGGLHPGRGGLHLEGGVLHAVGGGLHPGDEGLHLGEEGRALQESGQYASYWNAFLFRDASLFGKFGVCCNEPS